MVDLELADCRYWYRYNPGIVMHFLQHFFWGIRLQFSQAGAWDSLLRHSLAELANMIVDADWHDDSAQGIPQPDWLRLAPNEILEDSAAVFVAQE